MKPVNNPLGSDGQPPEALPPAWLPPEELVDAVDPTPFLDVLVERFGMPRESFDRFLVHQPNRDTVWIVDRDIRLPSRPAPHALGMPFFYPQMRFPRPTTSAAMHFGYLATRNVIDIEADELPSLVFRRPILADAGRLDAAGAVDYGYAFLRYRGAVLCLAYVDPAAGVVKSLCPKEWTTRLGFEPPPRDFIGIRK